MSKLKKRIEALIDLFLLVTVCAGTVTISYILYQVVTNG